MIVLAMPVQGIAAATMRFCAPAHHSQTQHAAAAQHAHHNSSHAAVSTAPHQHDAQAAAEAANDASKHRSGTTSKVKCSVCAVCCMATALAPDIPTVHAVDAGSTVVMPASVSYVGPVADGLERPPRPFLA